MKTGKLFHFLIILIVNLISVTGIAQENINRIFDASSIKIAEIKTNTIRSDFGPTVVGDTLYFTSYSDKVQGKPDKNLRNSAFYDLFRAKIDEHGNTITEREPVSEFLTKYHDGPVSYCKATGELFVTQSDNESASVLPKFLKRDTIRLRIIIAKQINGKWTSVINFPYNNPKYSVGHPAISLTGDTLVFSSDQPGGYGKTDLYYSVREAGIWSIPVNMGPQINTSGKEEFSFIAHNHTGRCFLIFASNGRPGFGGLDLYYTQFPYYNNEIEHFGAPINTPDDDFDMIIPDDADFDYLASNRPGTGSDDIYKFTFKKLAEPVVVIPPPEPLSPVKELYVYSTRTRKPILNTKIITCDNTSYSTDPGGKAALLNNNKDECEVLAQKFGFNPTKKLLMAKLVTKGDINRDTLWMDPIVGKITLLNIYYDYDKSDILPESAVELDRLIAFMNENPDFKVQLSSHTDSRGNDAYNLRLSERRAKSAVKYIVLHGIKADRITGKGYGETRLLNKCANGVECTPQEHRQNRRTEVFVPEIGQSNDVKQTEGDHSGVPDAKQNNPGANKKDHQPVSGSINKTDPIKKAEKSNTGSILKVTPLQNTEKSLSEKRTKGEPPRKTKIKMAKVTSASFHKAKPNNKTDNSTSSNVPNIKSKKSGRESKTYLLIISSFQQKANADRFLKKVIQKGIQAQIVIANPYFRIGIAHKTLTEAKEAMVKIRREFTDCWIL